MTKGDCWVRMNCLFVSTFFFCPCFCIVLVKFSVFIFFHSLVEWVVLLLLLSFCKVCVFICVYLCMAFVSDELIAYDSKLIFRVYVWCWLFIDVAWPISDCVRRWQRWHWLHQLNTVSYWVSFQFDWFLLNCSEFFYWLWFEPMTNTFVKLSSDWIIIM